MPAVQTQIISARRTEVASRGSVLAADKLYGVVKAFNMRQGGRDYTGTPADSLFDAVKAFNTRRFA